MLKVAISNQKGGTGKTTTTVNFAAALARAGMRVLLVDFDPQASLTEYFTSAANLVQTTYDLVRSKEVVKPLVLGSNISLLPTNIDLAAAEVYLPTQPNPEKILDRKLRNYDFDVCLIDCPPSLGILNRNALAAANLVIVPVATELMAERTMKLILDSIELVKESELNPNLEIWRVLPTLYDGRLSHNKEILQALKDKYTKLYSEPVKLTTRYKDAVTAREDVSTQDAAQGEYWDRMAVLFIKETMGVANGY